jgi:outer membrane protein TolC
MNQELHDAGRLARIELLQSDADLAQAELGLARAQNSALASVSALLQGLGPDWAERHAQDVVLADELPVAITNQPAGAQDDEIARAVNARADLQVAQALLEIARLGEAKVQDDARPTMDLRLGLLSSRPVANGSAGSQSQMGVSWSLPLDQGLLRQQRTQAQVELQRAELLLTSATRQVRSEVIGAQRELAFAQAQQVMATRNVELQQHKLGAETERFRAGKTSGFQLSAAQNELAIAETARIEAALTLQLAQIELDRATGRLAARRETALHAAR